MPAAKVQYWQQKWWRKCWRKCLVLATTTTTTSTTKIVALIQTASPVLVTTKTTTAATTTTKKVAELKPRKYKIATSEPNSCISNNLICVPLYRIFSLSLPFLPHFPDRPHESK